MPRGRRATPDAIKELKGNPGKRRLALNDARETRTIARALPSITVPDFLKHERERTIFKRMIEDFLQRRIARECDLIAYGRWASYMHEWLNCKEFLDGTSKFYKIKSQRTGDERLAQHPMWLNQMTIEKALQSLEDRLGLNPAARQTILRGLAAMPSAMQLGEDQQQQAEDLEGAVPPPPKEGPAQSPLGFLRMAGSKPH